MALAEARLLLLFQEAWSGGAKKAGGTCSSKIFLRPSERDPFLAVGRAKGDLEMLECWCQAEGTKVGGVSGTGSAGGGL